MGSFLFKNIKTGETKVVNSKDSKQAHKSYENGTWKYVKAVPKQSQSKTSKSKIENQSKLWVDSCKLVSLQRRLKDYAEDYDMKGLRPLYIEMEEILGEVQSILRNSK